MKIVILIGLFLFHKNTMAQTNVLCSTADGYSNVNGDTTCSVSGSGLSADGTTGSAQSKKLYYLYSPSAGPREIGISTQNNTRKHEFILKDKLLTELDVSLPSNSPISVNINSDAKFNPPETTTEPYVTSDAPSYVIMVHDLDRVNASVRGFMGVRGKDASEKCAERIQAGFTGNAAIDNTIRSLFNARCIGDTGPYPESFFSTTPPPCSPSTIRQACDNEDLKMISRVANQDKVDMCSSGAVHDPAMDDGAPILNVQYKKGKTYNLCSYPLNIVKRPGESCAPHEVSTTLNYNTGNCSKFEVVTNSIFSSGSDLVWEIPSDIRFHSTNTNNFIYTNYSHTRVLPGESETGSFLTGRLAQYVWEPRISVPRSCEQCRFYIFGSCIGRYWTTCWDDVWITSGCLSGYGGVSNNNCSMYYRTYDLFLPDVYTYHNGFWHSRNRMHTFRNRTIGSSSYVARITNLSCEVAQKQSINLNACASSRIYTASSCYIPNSTHLGVTNMHFLETIYAPSLWPNIQTAYTNAMFSCGPSGCSLPTEQDVRPVNYSYTEGQFLPRSQVLPSAQMNSKSGKLTILAYDASNYIISDYTQIPHSRNGLIDINYQQTRYCKKITSNPEYNQYKDFNIILQKVFYKPINYSVSEIELPNDIVPLSPSFPTPERLVVWKKLSPGAMDILYGIR